MSYIPILKLTQIKKSSKTIEINDNNISFDSLNVLTQFINDSKCLLSHINYTVELVRITDDEGNPINRVI